MVVTILEAAVAAEKQSALEEEFKRAVARLDPGIQQAFLLHGARDNEAWKIVTVWESRQALDQMRQTNETPRGVLIFRSVGVEPALSVFDVPAFGTVKV